MDRLTPVGSDLRSDLEILSRRKDFAHASEAETAFTVNDSERDGEGRLLAYGTTGLFYPHSPSPTRLAGR